MAQTLLTISILVSGRAETTERCLESLRPIMDSISTELILVDTGCGDILKHKLEKYATKIIPFTWCNDFSKARNIGLKEATGQWFLYLDDDEWFADTEDLIAFFQSGDYQRFASASYIQRNYLDMKVVSTQIPGLVVWLVLHRNFTSEAEFMNILLRPEWNIRI